jgi:hypothetical protein
MGKPRVTRPRRIMGVAVVALLATISTASIAPARAGQPAPVATLSISADVQGSDGLPPDLDILVVTGLELAVDERACGGPSFSVALNAGAPAYIWPPDAVTVLDAAELRVDVEVPTVIDGTDCEYTIDPVPTLVCYRTEAVAADGPEVEQLLNEAGDPTGEAVSPAAADVVAVTATYTDRCSEVRVQVDGLREHTALIRLDSQPADPADRSMSCDFGSVGPSPLPFQLSSGAVLVHEAAPAGCVATLTLTVQGCTITPPSDQFVIEHPVTTRQLRASCAAAAPVPAAPAFAG